MELGTSINVSLATKVQATGLFISAFSWINSPFGYTFGGSGGGSGSVELSAGEITVKE